MVSERPIASGMPGKLTQGIRYSGGYNLARDRVIVKNKLVTRAVFDENTGPAIEELKADEDCHFRKA